MPDDCALKPPIEVLAQMAQERAMWVLSGREWQTKDGRVSRRGGNTIAPALGLQTPTAPLNTPGESCRVLDPARQPEPGHLTRRRPATAAWDGPRLLAEFRAGVERLDAHVDEVNRSNVFPIPDGDTGANMVATVRAALTEAERARGASAGAGGVAAALARGALMGARGNSGVITSEFLGGVASALAEGQTLTGSDVARALLAGSARADGAVAMPVEGTILTVIRDAARAAGGVAAHDDAVEHVLGAAVAAAWDSVARTPTLLGVLRDAGVVDAGGQAMAFLFE